MNYLQMKKKAMLNYVSGITPPLPSEYQQVEWIGNDTTAYLIIDTNYQETDEIETVFSTTETSTDRYTITQRPFNNPSNSRFGLGIHVYFSCPYGNNNGETNRLVPNTRNTDFNKWTLSNRYVEVENTCDKTLTGTYRVGESQKLYIFYTANAVTKGKIKSFTQKRNGQEIVNLIPCYRKSDNEIGMYDTVTQTFYTNSGSGTFTKGQDV